MRTVRARFEGGVLRPLEPLDLREGEEVEVSIYEDVRRLFGVIRLRRPDIDPSELDKVIEEIESEGVL